MIILTTPEIANFNPKRQSSTEHWTYQDYCLAEVDDSFCPTEAKMEEEGLDFWWALSDGHFNVDEFVESQQYTTSGLIELIAWTYDISKEVNLAMAIHTICKNIGGCPFEFWKKFNK